MVGIEKSWDIEVGTDVLNDDVRRDAPPADGDETSNAFARSRSRRSRPAIRCCPSADRSASCERSSALAPVSMPSDVAVSGTSRSRPLPMSSSNALASGAAVGEEVVAAAVDAGSRLHADISGKVAVDARVAMASRRVIKESDNGSSG